MTVQPSIDLKSDTVDFEREFVELIFGKISIRRRIEFKVYM